MAEMVAEDKPQTEIAVRFNLSQSQVSRDVKEIYARWAEKDPTSLAVQKARFLARFRQ